MNRRLSRDVANGEHIEGSLADCISGRLHLPSHRAQRVHPAARLVREYTGCCGLFILPTPDLVLERGDFYMWREDLSDCIGRALIGVFIHSSPGCPRSRAEYRLKPIYGLIYAAEVQMH